MLLLVLGLIISLPLVMYGSTLLITLMERFAFIIVIGAALIGWVGGETIAHDTLFKPWSEQMPWLQYVCAAVGAAVVVGWGRLMERKAKD
jgi:predicted tellurium resistance membrane protein TerC